MSRLAEPEKATKRMVHPAVDADAKAMRDAAPVDSQAWSVGLLSLGNLLAAIAASSCCVVAFALLPYSTKRDAK